MKQSISLVLLLLIFSVIAGSQTKPCKSTLCGVVTDSETKKPIPFAEIFIEETKTGTLTDAEGKFHFHNICDGEYTVVSSHIGCPHIVKKVQIQGYLEVDFQLTHQALGLHQVVVRATSIIPHHIQSQHEISGSTLDARKGKSFGEMLKTLPGVSVLTTGANISKPVIHGMHSNRVLVINNGVRLEGQQWGLEHGLEIDPFGTEKVTVVMGANSVRYGSDALGGVIIAEPSPLREEPGIGGEVNLAGFSNGRMGAISATLDGRLSDKLPLVGRLHGTLKRSGAQRTPEYFLENTGVKELNFLAAAGLQKERFELEASYSEYSTDIGLFEGAHISNLDDLLDAIERGRPEEDGEFSYELGGPLQRVSHKVLKTAGVLKMGKAGSLNLQYARQADSRQEFEEEDHDSGIDFDHPEAQFNLITHTADAVWDHKPWKNLRGAAGLQLMRQENTTVAGDLIPDYRSTTAGIFWLERWRKFPLPFELEAGLRYDFRKLNIERRGVEIIDKELEFNNLTGTIGGIYRLPKNFEVRLSAGSAWRSPSVNELYSDGVHEGTASYETGQDNLVPEREYSAALKVVFAFPEDHPRLIASLNLFNNFVDNFIYLKPLKEPVVTDEGAFPAFQYEQANANLRGLDWEAQWKPVPSFAISSSISLLRAWNRSTDEPLVFMPPNRFRHGLSYFIKRKDIGLEDTFIGLSMTNVLKQNKVPANQDFAATPDGYTLFNLEAGTVFPFGKQKLKCGLAVENILNTSYRDYLNRLRYFATEPGRNVSVYLKWEF